MILGTHAHAPGVSFKLPGPGREPQLTMWESRDIAITLTAGFHKRNIESPGSGHSFIFARMWTVLKQTLSTRFPRIVLNCLCLAWSSPLFSSQFLLRVIFLWELATYPQHSCSLLIFYKKYTLLSNCLCITDLSKGDNYSHLCLQYVSITLFLKWGDIYKNLVGAKITDSN